LGFKEGDAILTLEQIDEGGIEVECVVIILGRSGFHGVDIQQGASNVEAVKDLFKIHLCSTQLSANLLLLPATPSANVSTNTGNIHLSANLLLLSAHLSANVSPIRKPLLVPKVFEQQQLNLAWEITQ
jgi:hypothetical protein